jgi:hypothetical protein
MPIRSMATVAYPAARAAFTKEYLLVPFGSGMSQ